MNVRDLKLSAAKKRLKHILDGLNIMDDLAEETIYDLLEGIENVLDELDSMDAMGTEGWKQNILGED